MELNSYLQECGDDDVIEFAGASFKLGKLKEILGFAFTNQNKVPYSVFNSFQEKGVTLGKNYLIAETLLNKGLDAEVLRLGAKGWQKGKVRIKVTLEFIPDEPELPQPESPLDDLRQMLNQDNQP